MNTQNLTAQESSSRSRSVQTMAEPEEKTQEPCSSDASTSSLSPFPVNFCPSFFFSVSAQKCNEIILLLVSCNMLRLRFTH